MTWARLSDVRVGQRFLFLDGPAGVWELFVGPSRAPTSPNAFCCRLCGVDIDARGHFAGSRLVTLRLRRGQR